MNIPTYEPVAYLLSVKSVEDDAGERADLPTDGEAEMCEVVAVSSDCMKYGRFEVGQTVFVEPCAYSCATRLGEARFVREESVLAIVTE